jgi:ATP-dependent Clp protease ATP-binding subunit ClpB
MADAAEAAVQPKWIEDIDRLLAIRPQFVLSGNIRDRFLTPTQSGLSLASVIPCLWALCAGKGFKFLLIYDRVDGIKVYPDTPENQNEASARLSLKFSSGAMEVNLATLLDKARLVAGNREIRIGLIIDYASRLTAGPQSLSADELVFFSGLEKLANSAMPVMPRDTKGDWLFNPIIWMTNRVQDLPSWYGLDSERIHSLEIARPSYGQRQAAARLLVRRIAGQATVSPETTLAAVRTFSESTDGLTLQAMSDISQLAVHQKIPPNAIDDAIRAFKVGNVRSPWKAPDMRERIATGAAAVGGSREGAAAIRRQDRGYSDPLGHGADRRTSAHLGHAATRGAVLCRADGRRQDRTCKSTDGAALWRRGVLSAL